MKPNVSSVTSLVSAFSRSYHSKHDDPKIFDDFIAKDLISLDEYSGISANMIQGISFFNPEIGTKYQNQPDEILKWINQVQLSPVPLSRSSYCEQVLEHEITLGAKQYVILGAGLDTYSFRHPEWKDRLGIFEVDYQATQEFKKKRLKEAGYEIPEHLYFIPLDFTDEFSPSHLLDNGFKKEKTFFSLLGVSYYLTKEENARLLANMFAMVTEGSSIVFDYADENLFVETGYSNRVANMLKMAEVGGEPMKSCFSYKEVEWMLQEAGLLIYEHLSPKKINEQFFHQRTDYLSAFEVIHFIHAVKK